VYVAKIGSAAEPLEREAVGRPAHFEPVGGDAPVTTTMAGVSPRLPSLRQPPIGFAHRGASAHAPENTIEGFALALRLGATGLESDVWLTADGEAVLDHDGRFGRVRRTPIARLRRQDLPAHIPSLAEVYEHCGAEFDLSLDLKVAEPEAVDAVLAAARAASPDAESRLWLCHPDHAALAAWRALAPESKLVHSTRLRRLEGGPERHAASLVSAGIDAVNLHHTDWNGGHIAMFHRFGLEALAWDCQHQRVLDEMIDAGIDAVYSDHVDRMVAAVEAATT
jgi:glycerophosphoryl diester phosphodiesterase